MKLKRIGVVKGASFMGLFGIFAGLISGILLNIIYAIMEPLIAGIGQEITGTGFMGILYSMITFGVAGFMGGFIIIPLANLILKLIKGIEIDFFEKESISNEKVVVQKYPIKKLGSRMPVVEQEVQSKPKPKLPELPKIG